MKNFKTNTKINRRFKSSESIEKAHLEEQKFEYLYTEGNLLILMNIENFEQISVSQEIIGEQVNFLVNNMLVTVELYDDKPISIVLPQTTVLEIIETEPLMKGASANPSYKPATLSNGVQISVPHYLVVGDKVVVKVEDKSFVERAK